MRNLSLVLFIVLAITLAGNAEILNVPDDFETIQAGIEASENGDTVLVAPGEYAEHLDYLGKAISVIGNPENPNEVIITRAEFGLSLVKFERGEGRSKKRKYNLCRQR